jgi:hypothetical protein
MIRAILNKLENEHARYLVRICEESDVARDRESVGSLATHSFLVAQNVALVEQQGSVQQGNPYRVHHDHHRRVPEINLRGVKNIWYDYGIA